MPLIMFTIKQAMKKLDHFRKHVSKINLNAHEMTAKLDLKCKHLGYLYSIIYASLRIPC